MHARPDCRGGHLNVHPRRRRVGQLLVVRVSPRLVFTFDFGDVPTWLALAGAAGVGVLPIRIERERDQRELADRRRQEAEAHRAQATKVTGWYGEDYEDVLGVSHPVQIWGAHIRNTSDAPVYDVRVDFHFSSPDVNDGAPAGPRGYEKRRVVPPGDTVFVKLPRDTARQVEQLSVYVITFTFRDAATRRWRREIDGTLTDISSDERA